MRSISSLPDWLFDKDRLAKLLIKEKKRRNVSISSLVFIGMHNISQYWWCGMYSVMKSRHNELEFFASYLQDRLIYALRLGHIATVPRKHEDILAVWDDIRVKALEQIYISESRSYQIPNNWIDDKIEDRRENLDIFHQGEIDQRRFAEVYTTFRWNFPYSSYVIVGVPDGITKDFVYEFKSTNKRHFLQFTKPVALTQADLYGFFFIRNKKRVQIYVREEGSTETFESPIDVDRVKKTLSNFESVDNDLPPSPPDKWKCKNCEFNTKCMIYQL